MNRPFIGICVCLALLPACGPSVPASAKAPASQPVQTLDQKLDMSAVKVGATRDSIETVLGQPMSVTESESGLQCMYMLGMKGFHMPSSANMGGMQALGAAQGLLGMAGGFAGPAGGLISGIAGQAIGIGSSMASQAAMPTMPDPSQIRMVIINYRDGKAVTINRMNPAAAGSAPIDQEKN